MYNTTIFYGFTTTGVHKEGVHLSKYPQILKKNLNIFRPILGLDTASQKKIHPLKPYVNEVTLTEHNLY